MTFLLPPGIKGLTLFLTWHFTRIRLMGREDAKLHPTKIWLYLSVSLLCISPYSVRMWENTTGQKKSGFVPFSRNERINNLNICQTALQLYSSEIVKSCQSSCWSLFKNNLHVTAYFFQETFGEYFILSSGLNYCRHSKGCNSFA